jgi:hypothetical protein
LCRRRWVFPWLSRFLCLSFFITLSVQVFIFYSYYRGSRFIHRRSNFVISRSKFHLHSSRPNDFHQIKNISIKMEKFTDNSPSSPQDSAPDYEASSLLNTHYIKQDAQRRRNYVYLTLFNLFIFTLSMLSLICAVMSQKDSSGHSAAKLMDEFGITCK